MRIVTSGFLFPLLALVLFPTCASAGLGDVAGIWQLDNNLDQANGGAALTANGFSPAYATSDIGGTSATVLDLDPLDPSQTLALSNAIGANGGGTAVRTNNWTLVVDVNLEMISTFQSLLQTDAANSDDQDVFVRPNGQVDFGPDVSEAGAVAPEQWYRIALTCSNDGDSGELTCTAYIDGVQTQIGGVPQSGTSGFDGQFSLDTVVNLFSDESSETDDMLVNSIAFWGEALSSAEVGVLGGAVAGGISIPDNPKLCPTSLVCRSSIDPVTVDLTWDAGENLDSTGIEILRDDVIVTTLAAGASAFSDTPTLPGGGGYATFNYLVRVAGADAGFCPPLTCQTIFFNGAIGDGSVLHLPLDVDGTDVSGLENNGVVNGAPTFVAGRISNAIQIDALAAPTQSVSVSDAGALNFGADSDFTVSVWVNNADGFETDPAIISNKDWASGSNPGWLIAANADGSWQWNIGTGAARIDYDGPAGQISDGDWHHLLVSHDRDGEAVLYYDGAEAARIDIAGFGNLDTEMPVVVGNDGTLNYPPFPGSIDDVIIWRRKVASSEVAKVYELGLADMTITHTVLPKICPSALSGGLSSRDPYSVVLNWSPAQNLDSTGLDVLLGMEIVASLAPGATTYTHLPDLSGPPAAYDLVYTVRMTGGSDSADCVPVSTTVSVFTGELTDDLVLYLPLENDATDFSGQSNHGTISGAPSFAAGQIDSAIVLTDPADPHQFVDVGTPSDLDFGTDTDFSVSVWVNNSLGFPNNTGAGGSNDDPAIVSNKDWDSGGNVGWLISAGGNGRWQWNIGDGAGRVDYDGPANQIDDGNWHHLCVTHDRDGLATFYYDGNQVATRDISGIGSIDSGLPTAVGTDGTFGAIWANWFPGSIDEVVIWRRQISDTDVASLFANGTNGQPLFNTILPVRITAIELAPDTGLITLTFDAPSGSTFFLEASGDLTRWSEIDDGVVGEGAGSSVTFADPDGAGASRRIYRLRAFE